MGCITEGSTIEAVIINYFDGFSTSKAKKYRVQLFKNDDKRGGSAGCAMMLVFCEEYFFGITMQPRLGKNGISLFTTKKVISSSSGYR